MHDLRRAEAVATVQQMHLVGETREERCLLHRGVAAADDRNLLAAEEETVTCRARRHPVAHQAVLVGQPEHAVGRAHREDDGAGAVGLAADDHRLDLAGERQLGRVVGNDLRAEALGLLAHVVHEVGTLDPVHEPGEVLHLGRVHQRAAVLHALDQQRAQVGTRGVDGSGVAGRSGPDDDHVADFIAHG